ncbi:MAG: hypothetical protein FJ030_03120 [Chloroflexi bacterium]|nr:hypothetical protein [Chloroflexota bacterium]
MRGYALVLVATVLWSTLGPLTRTLLQNFSLPAISIAFLRAALASSLTFVALALTRRDLLRMPANAASHVLALGIVGIGGFYAALAKGIEVAGIALLAVLTYMAPVWVTVVGAVALNEPLNSRKVVALALSLTGCALASKVYDIDAMIVSLPGIAIGLAASVGYAAFAIFSKTLSGKCDPRAMLMYAYGIGAIVLLPFQSSDLARALQPAAWPLLAAIAIGPTLGAWGLFSLSLRFVPVSNAAIVTSLDVVFSNLAAFLLYRELLDFPQMIGGALILAAVALLQLEPPNHPTT